MSKSYSDILITTPISRTLFTAAICSILIGIYLFLYMGEYTKRQLVSGILVPNKGLIKVYAPEPGIIAFIGVNEGDYIEEGQLLYLINSAAFSAKKEQNRKIMKQNLLMQEMSLSEENKRQKVINKEQKIQAENAIAAMTGQLEEVSRSQVLIKQQITLANEILSTYESLKYNNTVSKVEIQERKMNVLIKETFLADLLTRKKQLERNLSKEREYFSTLRLQGENHIAQNERQLEKVRNELLVIEPEREIKVFAPAAGIVTGLTYKKGQRSEPSKPLLSVIPEGTMLEAELYIPTHSIGFIRKGNDVLLRYRAFPYQKFGQHKGKIAHIDRAAMTVEELVNNTAFKHFYPNQPIYRVTVTLPFQTIQAYGVDESLQVGMGLEADVLLETRYLYEWIFEPLFSITG